MFSLISIQLSLVKFGCLNTANRWMLSIDLVSNCDHDQFPLDPNLYNHIVSSAVLWKWILAVISSCHTYNYRHKWNLADI